LLALLRIGDGAYSVVYKVKRVSDGQIYALKKVNCCLFKWYDR
jgi:serine/threonine protein kinase